MVVTDMFKTKTVVPTPERAVTRRAEPVPTACAPLSTGRPLKEPYPEGLQVAYLGMGCFWGAERLFWKQSGVYVTAVGYAGGITPNPTYQETTTGLTGHAEIVKVVFDPSVVSYRELLRIFFEEHDPTQGMRQGNDIGTTYRSAIYTTHPQQEAEAGEAVKAFQQALDAADRRARITTEVAPIDVFYYAEDYHQQYLAKNPGGYCGLKGTGVTCPIG